jgi:pyrimidine-specific ribonucleoside hydrolase
VPDAVALYRHILARQPDHSVTIVAIGSYANLASLLTSKAGDGSGLGGRKLIAAKVKKTVIEDGLFPNNGVPAFTNQKLDLAAATKVVNGHWPTPIAWVDGLTGVATKVGRGLCAKASAKNPMRIVYENKFGCGPPGDGDWDGPTLLYALQGTGDLFTELGHGGSAFIDADGGLSWRADPGRPRDGYVHVDNQSALNQEINKLLKAN